MMAIFNRSMSNGADTVVYGKYHPYWVDKRLRIKNQAFDRYSGIIFNLDQTLVNSQIADHFRRSRQWSRVYDMIPGFQAYDGISLLLDEIYRQGNPVCVVTSAPGSYCRRVIDHFQWPINQMVCYHDTRSHKPHPEPIQRGIGLLGLSPDRVVSVGDAEAYTIASRAAGVTSVGALWGSLEAQVLIGLGPDYVCSSVNELRRVIGSSYE